jgi:WD40 repeat protein/serine/threonine protein kinase
MNTPDLQNPALLSVADESLAQVLFDLAERRRQGESIDLSQVAADHPQHAAKLQRLLPMVEALAAGGQSTPAAVESAGGGESHAIIGDYQLVREIGRGGMGIVYEARQVSLNRRVALKVLPFASALDPRALARFRQESLAAAQLDHPHIVQVHNVGCDRGIHYYAMQYIEGRSLAEVIAEMRGGGIEVEGVEKSNRSKSDEECGVRNSECGIGIGITVDAPIPNSEFRTPHLADPKSEVRNPKCPSRTPSTLAIRAAGISTDRVGNRREFFRGVARLGIQAAEALDYAHQRGILHRDIKPANLMLDDAGGLWIADFGLAHIESDENLTRTGDVMGTLRYTSPEQALGERGLVGPRTDVYSLGATLYELLSLEPVFPDNDRARLLQQIAGEMPAPLRRFDRAIPEELETIVAKCLEKDPADRYATAGALADDLTRYLDHQPLRAKRAAWTERLRKWSRRHHLAVVAASVTISLCTTFLAVSALWVAHEHDQTVAERAVAKQHKDIAETRQTMLRQSAYASRFHLAHAAWTAGDLAQVKLRLAECLPGPGEEDLRGFEWYWLSHALESTPTAWRQHVGETYAAQFSPDGGKLATCGQDGCRIWSWPGGETLMHLTAHANDVNDCGFSPDGELLATASDDGTVRIWDTTDWSERHLLVHDGWVIAALFSPDGQKLATAERHVGTLSADGRPVQVVRLWNVPTWEETGRLTGPAGELHALAWSPDGTQIAAAGDGVRVWDVASGSERFTDEGFASCVAFAHQRPLLAASVGGRTVIYDLESGRAVSDVPIGCETVAFGANDSGLLTAGRDRFARIWSFTGTGEELVERAAFRDTSPLWSATFAPDGQVLVTTNHDGSIKRWDRNHLPDRLHLHRTSGKLWEEPVEFSPDAHGLLYNNDSLRLVDLEAGSVLRMLAGPGEVFCAMALSPDGKWLAAGDRRGRVDLWDTRKWHRRSLIEADADRRLENPIESLAFIPGIDVALVVIARDRTFVAGPAPDDALPIPSGILGKASMVIFSPDGRLAALLMQNAAGGGVQIWDVRSTERLLIAEEASGCPVFSSDGRLFAATCRDGGIRVWQFGFWDEPALLAGRGAHVMSMAISPDGRTLATAADDATVKLWNAATGRELLTFEAGLFGPTVCFSRDGAALAVSGTAGRKYSGPQVIVWRGEGAASGE